ncbi:hypothetical protein GWN63_04570, partial [Candidatus Bathyarchaeota archaeon]|nr:hypothetical protein [Candidatus Bathyarchaeota archaeon]NIR18025.1 hypothetical protein [Desulfobacterales bacterium]NIU81501.1 hypothetical protein [Candidatus Bathyarchaeota archaeon]NIV67262.1 hypothetical protein [Candidatus Bathyarchaeota archaeon]
FNTTTYYNSNVVGIATVTDLAPDEERDIIFEWNTTGIAEGNYTIKAEADIVPYELDTGDNTLTDGVVWVMTQIHDVATVDVTLSSNASYQGWIIGINVTAENLGGFNETFDVKAYLNTTLIGTIHVADLAPGNQYLAEFDLNTSGLTPCHTYI